jgi:large subunit ribosomal protein L25
MATVQVKTELRTAGGKGEARQLRMSGRIPGIVYGAGEESLPISLDSASFELLLRHISGNAILELEVRGREGTEYKVIIKEVQRNPINSKVLHVDLEHISMTRKVRVMVPVRLHGTPLGVKEGGILEHLLREIEVECLPAEIPEEVSLDVSELERAHSVHVRDLDLGSLHVIDSPERVVATVVSKAKEEEAPAAAEAAVPAEGEAAAAEEPKKGD